MNPNEHRIYELLQPWSSFVLKTKLPDKILKKMIELTNKIVVDSNVENWGPNLAGQIAWEPKIDLKLIEKTDIEKYFYSAIHQYCMRAHLQTYPFQHDDDPPSLTEYSIDTMWIVSQKDNEYNPIHIHTNCSLSAVMYLKVPKFLPARKQRNDHDGNIVFYQSAANPEGVFGNIASISVKQKVGDFYIFSAAQAHQVYPFRTVDGKGERRSVSFNVSCSRNIEQFNKWEDKEQRKNLTNGQSSKKIRRY